MIRTRFRRYVALTAVVMTIGGVSGFLAVQSASASFVGIKCAAYNTIAPGANAVLTGCTGNTGGSSQAFSTTVLLIGGTITWTNGDTTTISGTATEGEKSTYKTESRDSNLGPFADCQSGQTEFELNGKTTADTTGSAPVGGKVKAELCFTPPNGWSNEGDQVVKIG